MSEQSQSPAQYKFGPFTVNTVKRQLMRGDQQLPIPPKTFELLLALIENGGRILSKNELINIVWPDTFVEEINISVHISNLRKILGDVSDEPKYIKTVPRKGYAFITTVVRVSKEVPENNSPPDFQAVQESSTPSTGATEMRNGNDNPRQRRGLSTISKAASVAILLTGVAVAYLLWRSPADNAPGFSIEGKSIAILPFEVIPQGEESYLSLGMADALITQLSNLKEIKVRPTLAVQRYAGQEVDPAVVGRELKVDLVITGTIQRINKTTRATVQLINVNDGTSLWADESTHASDDILRLQSAISQRIAKSLSIKLSGAEPKLFAGNPYAYEAYLRGKYFWQMRTYPEVEKSIVYFKRAIELDPEFALAHAALADSYIVLANNLRGDSRASDLIARAKAAATRALEIDNQIAETYIVLGGLSINPAEAENAYQRSLELSPNNITAMHRYGMMMLERGEFDRAINLIERAFELDPVSIILGRLMAEIRLIQGDYQASVELCKKTLEMNPDFHAVRLVLARAYVQMGLFGEAIIELKTLLKKIPSNASVAGSLGHTYALAGNTAQAERILRSIRKRYGREPFADYGLALIYTGLGEKARAFEWLRRAVKHDSIPKRHIYFDPRIASLRSDARFVEITFLLKNRARVAEIKY